MKRKEVKVIIHNNFTTSTERYNDWYYNHLLGGCTNAYCAFTQAWNEKEYRAMWAFCQMCNKNKKCTEMCDKLFTFRDLMNLKETED